MTRTTMGADDLLARIPLFAALSDRDRRQVRDLFTQIDVEAGRVLTRQGEQGHEFLVVVSGTASVSRDGRPVAEVGTGDFQGEISLLDGGPRTATVTATTPMSVLVASRQEFVSLLDRQPGIARQMLPVLAQRVRAMNADAVTH